MLKKPNTHMDTIDAFAREIHLCRSKEQAMLLGSLVIRWLRLRKLKEERFADWWESEYMTDPYFVWWVACHWLLAWHWLLA